MTGNSGHPYFPALFAGKDRGSLVQNSPVGPSERGVNSSCAASPSPPLLHAAGMNLVRAMMATLRLALATAMPVLTCLSVHCTGNINERGVHPLLDDHRVHASSPVETTGGDEFAHVLTGAHRSCRSTHGRRIG